MMTYRNGTVPTHVWPRLYSLLAHGHATLHTWQHRREERRALRDLLRLDDWLLADIGRDRAAVAWEARRPFWQPLAMSDQRIDQPRVVEQLDRLDLIAGAQVGSRPGHSLSS